MTAVTTRFEACAPIHWKGRYARIPGGTSVFHLRHIEGRLWPVLDWQTDAGIATCCALDSAVAADLATAVARAKTHAGGNGAGAFLINEYGQVLVPASDGGGRRFLAGRLDGLILFDNPFRPGRPIDLGDHKTLQTGDPWTLPYVGIPYHLHRRSTVYFYQQDAAGGRSLYPPQQDPDLIRAIRNIRQDGPVRILVNPAGLVLTKVPSGGSEQPEDCWRPVFVGSINPRIWFQEE